jgi:hypothetical protein
MHYTELLALDGETAETRDEDVLLRNTIAWKLDQWGLAVVVEPSDVDRRVPDEELCVVPYRSKEQWNLTSRYVVGKKRD